jgi:hypothetical protein
MVLEVTGTEKKVDFVVAAVVVIDDARFSTRTIRAIVC